MKNLKNVAYLPTLEKPAMMSNAGLWRQVKLAYFSKALTLLLKPLKVCTVFLVYVNTIFIHALLAQDASHTGMNMYDPSGRYQLVYPRLLSYVVDDPEGKDVMCIKGGNSKHPC